MLRPRFPSLTLAAAITLTAGYTSAQNGAEVVPNTVQDPTPPSSSNSEQDPPSRSVILEEETVSASRGSDSTTTPNLQEAQQQSLRKPGAVSFVGADRFQNGRSSNAEDILKLVPGVWAVDQNGGEDVYISIRGSNLSGPPFGRGNLSFYDGVIPLAPLDSGTNNQLINQQTNQYVEVYRGGSALDLGAATVGGVINYVPHTGHTAERLQVRFSHGSDEYYTAQISSGMVLGDWDYYVSLDGLSYDGFRNQSEVATYRVASNLGYQISDSAETRFYFFFSNVEQNLPGAVGKSTAKSNPSAAGFFNSIVDTDRNWDDFRFANKTTIDLNENTTATLSGYYVKAVLDHLPTPFVGIIDNTTNEFGFSAQLDIDYDLADMPNKLLVGGRIRLNDSELTRFRTNSSGREKRLQTFDQDFEALQTELFVQNDTEFVEDWHLVLGLQYIQTDRDINDNTLAASPPAIPPFPPQPSAIAGDQSFEESFEEFNPRIAVIHDVTETANLFASISRASGFASASEIASLASFGFPTNNLEAQTGWTFELGSRGSHEDWLAWDITPYYSRVRNDLLRAQGPFPNTNVVANFDTEHMGVEVGVDVDVLRLSRELGGNADGTSQDRDRLPLRVVYNYSDFNFDGDPTFGDSRLPKIPEHTVYASLEYEHRSGAYLGPNARIVSGYGLTYDGSGGDAYDIDGYVLLGLKGGFRADRWDAYFDLRNLGDVDFLADGSINPTSTMGGEANVTPGNGFQAYAGFSIRF